MTQANPIPRIPLLLTLACVGCANDATLGEESGANDVPPLEAAGGARRADDPLPGWPLGSDEVEGSVSGKAAAARPAPAPAAGSADPPGAASPANAGSPGPAIEPRRTASAGTELLRSDASPLEGFPRGAEQLARVCGRGRNDRVVRALCSSPKIDSLRALQDALGLRFTNSAADPGFSLLGHSMSLVAQQVSSINPRAIVFSSLLDSTPGAVVLAFTRGETFVEIAAQDSTMSPLTFYLVEFEIACEQTGTCAHGELLTPAIEKDWRGFSLYDEEDLKNTTVDCRQCHQRTGPSVRPALLMHEFLPPWTHWFSSLTAGGGALIQEFTDAHGSAEDYAGIPANLLPQANPALLNSFLLAQGHAIQPLNFQSVQIEFEVQLSATAQPHVNVPSGTSETWQALYDSAAAGDSIPPPYHDVKVTDAGKLALATKSYQAFKAGEISAEELVDIRDVFLDEALPDLMFVPAKGLSGREILVQACAQCHNSRLDQTLSRANFDVTRLDQMSPEVKALAIERLERPASDIARMPPVRFRSLPREAIELAVEELRR